MSYIRLKLNHPIAYGLQGVGVGAVVLAPSRAVLAATYSGVGKGGQAFVLGNGLYGDFGVFPAQTDTTSFTMAYAPGLAPANQAYGVIGNRSAGGATATDHTKLGGTFVYSSGADGNRNLSSSSYTNSVLVAVKSGLTLSLYADGLLVASATYTTGQLNLVAKRCYYGCDEAGLNTTPAAGWFWPSRALSSSEITRFSARPYDMLSGVASSYRTPKV